MVARVISGSCTGMASNFGTLAEHQCSFEVPEELGLVTRNIGSGNGQGAGVRAHAAGSRGYGSCVANFLRNFQSGLIPLRVESGMGVGKMLHRLPQFLFHLE